MAQVSDYINASPKIYENAVNSLYGPAKARLANQTADLANQKSSAMLPFVAPKEQADLQKSQLANKYYGPMQQAEIGQRNALANQTNAQISNMAPETFAKVMTALPTAAQYDFYQKWSGSGGKSPDKLSGMITSQMAPAQSGGSQFSPSDQEALKGITTTAMTGGGDGMGQRHPLLPPVDQLPEQYRTTQVPTAMTGAPDAAPAAQSSSGNGANQDFQKDATLASELAIGDPASREGFIAKFPAYSTLDTINTTLFNNPNMMKRYSGAVGKAKYEYDLGQSKLGNPVPAEFTAMQNLQNNYKSIGGDQLAKMFANSGTKAQTGNMQGMLDKGFSPGATEAQALTASTALTNLQANEMRLQAQKGGQSQTFKDIWGVSPDRDFTKEPILPNMTPDQAHTFLLNQSPASRKMYSKGLNEMIARQQHKAQPKGAANG